jgi:phosphoglycolate phosphatase-like HAD superfamily hydrolase
MKTIIFDFDGTILDSTLRLYTLFIDITKFTDLTYDKYWGLKRNGVSNIDILKSCEINGINNFQFTETWMNQIESNYYLEMDELYADAFLTINDLHIKGYKLILCTARQNHECVLKQLDKFKINFFFDSVLVTEQKHSKSELIDKNYNDLNVDFVVGDTPKDIELAKHVNARSVSITHGFLDARTLKKYNPDFMVDNFKQLSSIL